MSIRVQQASVKIFATTDSVVELDDLIPVFHAWIRDKRITDHLLIDVADYRHVPDGPGVMLIANEAHYGIDSGGGEPGLLYARKRDPLGDAEPALRDALQRAAQAAALLEEDELLGGKLRFRTSDVQLRLMSRLTTPNDDATQAQIEPIWADMLAGLGYEGLEITREADPRKPFSLRVSGCSSAPDLASLRAAR